MWNKLLASMFFLALSLNAYASMSDEYEVKHFMFPIDGQLSKEMKAFYDENGFLIFDDFYSPETCQKLSEEGLRIISESHIDPAGMSIFATDETGNKSVVEKYFLNSADKIKLFFEASAVVDGQLQGPVEDCVNKIAHALGELNPYFSDVTFDARIGTLANQLGQKKPTLAQSMMILKPAGRGGAVVPHQDATFIRTEPNSCLGFWTPLQEATLENACLQAVPGSHKSQLFVKYKRTDDGNKFEIFDSPFWEDKSKVNPFDWAKHLPDELNTYIPLPMKSGTLFVFHGNLLHKSEANISDKSRHAYTFHVVDGDCKWPEDNWLQKKHFPLL